MGKENILALGNMATGMKYLASMLRVVRGQDNLPMVENYSLFPDNLSSSPYPLVSGKDLYGKDLLVPLTIRGKTDEISFQEAIVNVSRERNIVSTPVLGGKGTIKEMVTEGDLTLSISLAVVSNTDAGAFDTGVCRYGDVYPYSGVKRVRQLLDEPNRLDIVSDFLKLFDLDGGDFGIVVTGYTVNQDTHSNRQVFEIQALSDYDYHLFIEE